MNIEQNNTKQFNIRIGCIIALTWIFVLVCFWRLAIVQYIEHDKYQALAKGQQTKVEKTTPIRGKILDRNMREFATTTMAYDLYIAPRDLKNRLAGKKWTKNQLREAGYPEVEVERLTEAKTTIPKELPKEAIWNLSEDIAALSGESVDAVYKIASGNGKNTTRTRTILSDTKQSIVSAYARLLGIEHILPKGKMKTSKRTVIVRQEPIDIAIVKGLTPELKDKFQEVFTQNSYGTKTLRPRYTYTTSTMRLMPSNAIYFHGTNKREYPQGELAGTIVGITNADKWGDNDGVAGIEKSYNDVLQGDSSTLRVRVTAGQKKLDMLTTDGLRGGYGHTVVMTIDERIQRETERALQHHVEQESAVGGQAVVLDVKTGEVLAMASSPSFDPSHRLGSTKNRCITDFIEPGSVIKTFVYASAIEAGKINKFTPINCDATVNIPGRKKPVTDAPHPIGKTVEAIYAFKKSSNVGAVHVMERMLGGAGRGAHFKLPYESLKKFGFGDKTGIDLPYESPGALKHYSQWNISTAASIAFGYEVEVTPIQMVTAMAAIGNGGKLMKPHVVKAILDFEGNTIETIEPTFVRQACSESTAKTMLELLEAVVVEGTATKAQLDNWRAGGKTGTSNKYIIGKGYDKDGKKHYGSCCGLVPITNPEVAIYIWIDEPSTAEGLHFGGTSAGPVFRDIADACMEIRKVPHQEMPVINPGTKSLVEQFRRKVTRAIRRSITQAVEQSAYNSPYSSSEIGNVIARLRGKDSNVPIAPGTMPDLRGLSLREASKLLEGIDQSFVVKGNGVVVSQIPEPYLPLAANDAKIQLTLGTPLEAELAILQGNELPGPSPEESEGVAEAEPQATPEPQPIPHVRILSGDGGEGVDLQTTKTIHSIRDRIAEEENPTMTSQPTASFPDKDKRVHDDEPVVNFSSIWQKYDLQQILKDQRNAVQKKSVDTSAKQDAKNKDADNDKPTSMKKSTDKKATKPDKEKQDKPKSTKKSSQDTEIDEPQSKDSGSNEPQEQPTQVQPQPQRPMLLRDRIKQRLWRRNPAPPRGQQQGEFYTN